MLLKELIKDTPIWMRVLISIQIIMYIVISIGVIILIQFVVNMDWSNGLEGIIRIVWKGK